MSYELHLTCELPCSRNTPECGDIGGGRPAFMDGLCCIWKVIGASITKQLTVPTTSSPWPHELPSPWSVLTNVSEAVRAKLSSLAPNLTVLGSPAPVPKCSSCPPGQDDLLVANRLKNLEVGASPLPIRRSCSQCVLPDVSEPPETEDLVLA